jgi:polar amino acid transport system permease protein
MYWPVVTQNFDLLLEGAFLTLKISLTALLFSIPLGVLIGLCRVSNKKIVKFLATAYVEFIRGVPLLVLLIWIYFVLGSYFNLGSYWSAIMGLSVFSAAFISEIVRSGIKAVPRGQMEAARSSGMTYIQAMRFVILPQAVRIVLPPMASQFIILIKDSSLVSTVAVVDLTLIGKNLVATTFRSLEVWTAIALLYFVMTFSLSLVIRYFEKKYTIK